MNSLKSILAIFMIFAACCIFVSCQGETKEPAKVKIEKATDRNGKEYTSRWICPMHCKGSGSEQRGQKCGACEMALVENKNHAHYGHNH